MYCFVSFESISTRTKRTEAALAKQRDPFIETVREPFDQRYGLEESDRNFVNALARGFDILRAFQTQPGQLSNTDFSRITGLSKATVSRLTYTLWRLGYLDQVGRKYRLNPALLSLAYPVLSSQPGRQAVHEKLTELAHQTKCNVALSVPSSNGINMIYLDCFNAGSVNTLHTDIGMRLRIANTSIGRAYLGGLNEEERQEKLSVLKDFHGSEWDQLLPRIEAGLDSMKQRGFCIVDGEWLKDTRAVATSMTPKPGEQSYSLSCGGPSFAVSADRLEQELGPRLVHIARSIEPLLRQY